MIGSRKKSKHNIEFIKTAQPVVHLPNWWEDESLSVEKLRDGYAQEMRNGNYEDAEEIKERIDKLTDRELERGTINLNGGFHYLDWENCSDLEQLGQMEIDAMRDEEYDIAAEIRWRVIELTHSDPEEY